MLCFQLFIIVVSWVCTGSCCVLPAGSSSCPLAQMARGIAPAGSHQSRLLLKHSFEKPRDVLENSVLTRERKASPFLHLPLKKNKNKEFGFVTQPE